MLEPSLNQSLLLGFCFLGIFSPSRRQMRCTRSFPSRDVVRFYNKRGTAEQWIKEGQQAVKMTRLSCHRFRSKEVRLWLSVIAYHLGNLWRPLALPRRIGNWSMTSLQQRLVKTGSRLVRHARYYWLLLAEGHLSRRLFGSMLRMIAALPLPDGKLTCTEGKRALGSHPVGKCQWLGRLGRTKPAQRLGRTAKTSRTTTPKRPARLAVDTTGQEG
jgi:Transposase DDE domain group 1